MAYLNEKDKKEREKRGKASHESESGKLFYQKQNQKQSNHKYDTLLPPVFEISLKFEASQWLKTIPKHQ